MHDQRSKRVPKTAVLWCHYHAWTRHVHCAEAGRCKNFCRVLYFGKHWNWKLIILRHQRSLSSGDLSGHQGLNDVESPNFAFPIHFAQICLGMESRYTSDHPRAIKQIKTSDDLKWHSDFWHGTKVIIDLHWLKTNLTRAPLALQIFHHLRGCLNTPPPSSSAPIGRIEKRGKSVRRLVKSDYETNSVNFSLMSKLWAPGPKNGQIFEFLAIVKLCFGKLPLSQELS